MGIGVFLKSKLFKDQLKIKSKASHFKECMHINVYNTNVYFF